MDDIDIRPALRQRLKAIAEERANIAARLKRLERLETLALELIAEDDNNLPTANNQASLPLHPTGRSSLSDFLMSALRTGPKTLDELKAIPELAHYTRAALHPGRAINFALVGLQKGEHVERLEDGTWKLASGESRK
jgi:hypothetical protein